MTSNQQDIEQVDKSDSEADKDFGASFFPAGADPLEPMLQPELVFGIVGPVGVDRNAVCACLESCIQEYNYDVHRIKVSELIKLVPGNEYLEEFKGDEYERIEKFMLAGTQTRESSGFGDAMAILAISEIAAQRKKLNLQENPTLPEKDASLSGRQSDAYILDSLKHPAEIKTLRATYGRAFHLISVHADRELRVDNLADRIAQSRLSQDSNHCRKDAETLVNRDENEEGTSLGQNVENTFPMADLFIDLYSDSKLFKSEISRFCEIIFNNPFRTPTEDEAGMFQAEAVSWRSADLSRQVGASICDDDGTVLAVGCNEVPKSGGGLYWENSSGDKRDFVIGVEQGTTLKRAMLAEVIEKLKNDPDLVDSSNHEAWEELKEDAISGKKSPLLEGLQALNVIEYGRSVHAEMAALSDAARNGVSVKGATMFANTFPCHICARHIIASGVKRVVYIQPYPKSLTSKLFSDSISTRDNENTHKVGFRPFSGIAPRFYQFAFQLSGRRKENNGKSISWKKHKTTTKLKRFVFSYIVIENQIIEALIPRIRNDISEESK